MKIKKHISSKLAQFKQWILFIVSKRKSDKILCDWCGNYKDEKEIYYLGIMNNNDYFYHICEDCNHEHDVC